MEVLHEAVLGVKDKLILLPTLFKFFKFLTTLVADPNFKISLSTMRILQDLLNKLGTDVQPYLGIVLEPLIEKLGDRNEVRSCADYHSIGCSTNSSPGKNINSFSMLFPSWSDSRL